MSTKLVTDVKPSQYAAYGQLQVGFYDKIKGDKPLLYVIIRNGDDKYSVVDRKADKRRVMDEHGEFQLVNEIELYKRAYEKYLKARNDNEVDYKSEYELAAKKVATLEAEAAKKSLLEENTSKAATGIVKEPKRSVNNG